MIACIVLYFLLIAGLALFPMRALRKRQSPTWWDDVYPFTGILVWFSLGMSNIGSSLSMSNFVIEVFWITILSGILPWGRWLLSYVERKHIKHVSFLLTVLPLLAAIIIRLTMPSLPE